MGHTIRHAVTRLIATLLLAGALRAADAPRFRAGDRWAVIGDSITHGRRYHSFVYLFYATRYPDAAFLTFNCGISGDSAEGAVKRFDWDIAVHQPTVATVLLGMNDVGRGLYASNASGTDLEQRRQACIDNHVRAMTQLAARLKASNCRTVFLTPTIYDQTGKLQAENCVGVNDALGRCGQRVRALAEQVGAAAIDLHGPMTELNARLQQTDPAATLVGPDRVHPGDPGQLVMAYLILKGMGVSGTVAAMAIDARQATVTAQENCQVTEVVVKDGRVSFTCLENALPYPVLPAAAAALGMVPFTAELNRETLTIAGLAPGRYAVTVDGQVVTAASEADLATGLNLADNPRSPMLKQAMQVLAAEERRQAIPASFLRNFAAQRHWLTRGKPDLNPDDFEAMKSVLEADVERKKALPNYAYFRGMADVYIKNKPRETELLRQLDERTADVWRLNRPVAHRFEIHPLTDDDQAALTARVLDDFDDATPWAPVSWTNTTSTVAVENGTLTVAGPRTPGKRDMLGLTRSMTADLTGVRALKIRYRADKDAPFGVEVTIDGKLTRLRSYLPAAGEWETVTLPVSGAKLSSLTLILAEPADAATWPTDRTTYAFDRIWLE